jgi:hypothetical protein
MSASIAVASPEPPPGRPSLAATHPNLFRQGTDILQDIMHISSLRIDEEGINTIVEGLEGFLSKVVEFVRDPLSSRGPNDSVAHWPEQTYRAIQRIERVLPRTKSIEEVMNSRATPVKPTWASVAAWKTLQPIGTPRMVHDDIASLRQIKIRIANVTERKTVWTTANRMIVEGVATKAKGSGVVGVKKLPSGDVLVQYNSKNRLVRRSSYRAMDSLTRSLPLLSSCLSSSQQ